MRGDCRYTNVRGKTSARDRVRGRLCRFHPCTDRKSTRLNSSHQIISYAVFCLKKKNKKALHTGLTTRQAHAGNLCMQYLRCIRKAAVHHSLARDAGPRKVYLAMKTESRGWMTV